MSAQQKRILKEIAYLESQYELGLSITENNLPKSLIIEITTASDSVYEGSKYLLDITFKASYPYSPPIVKFVKSNVPMHPHVYSNGHLCLSILGTDWTPAMSLWSICVSIVSMLNSCTLKSLPPDNESYIRRNVSDPTSVLWDYHGTFHSLIEDDKV